MQNLDQTVISQYDSDPVTDALVGSFGQAINPDYLFDMFFNYIWGALLAENQFINWGSTESYGLDIWGRIVGINRVVTGSAGNYLGMSNPNTGETSGTPFNFGIFYTLGSQLTTNFILTNQAFLLLILAKAAANITNGSIPALNQLLLNLFPGRGNCYVEDNQNMTLTLVFTFPLQAYEKAIIQNSGVLPIPTGVEPLYSFVN